MSCRNRSLESGTIPRRAKYVDLPAPGSPIARTTFRVGRPFRDAVPTSVPSYSSVAAPSLVVSDAWPAAPRSPSTPINTVNKQPVKRIPHSVRLICCVWPRKPPVEQQLQNMLRVAPVGLLPPHHHLPDLRRIPNPQLLLRGRQHPLEPLRVAHRFHPHPHLLPLQCFIESPGFSSFVLQSPFPQLARRGVHHGDLLVAGVKSTSYNPPRGPFLPEPWFWQPQVYSEGSRSRAFVIPSSAAKNPSFLSPYPSSLILR